MSVQIVKILHKTFLYSSKTAIFGLVYCFSSVVTLHIYKILYFKNVTLNYSCNL